MDECVGGVVWSSSLSSEDLRNLFFNGVVLGVFTGVEFDWWRLFDLVFCHVSPSDWVVGGDSFDKV